jgi:hypothetical protein
MKSQRKKLTKRNKKPKRMTKKKMGKRLVKINLKK